MSAKAACSSDDASGCLARGEAVAVPLSTVFCAAGKGSSVGAKAADNSGGVRASTAGSGEAAPALVVWPLVLLSSSTPNGS